MSMDCLLLDIGDALLVLVSSIPRLHTGIHREQLAMQHRLWNQKHPTD